MPPPSIIPTLVQRFADNHDSYIASTYNEATLRQDYLNPFLEALGWDVRNKQGYSEAFKEVIIEERVKVGEANKAPDYSCRIGGRRIFFVEAKKPSVNIRDDAKAAYQLRRYRLRSSPNIVHNCRIRIFFRQSCMNFMHYPKDRRRRTGKNFRGKWASLANIEHAPGGFKKNFPRFLNDNYIDSEQVKEKRKGIFIEGKNTE
jgi:hypothetical protein